MIDVKKILSEISDNEKILEPNLDLIESGIMDSLFLIELIDRFEDEGVKINLTQIDRTLLRTVGGIEKIISDAQ